MPSLHDLQQAFGVALLSGDSASLEPHVVANGVAPAARVRIYRNNARENFLATLRTTFPVLERLVGEDYFRQMACDYREQFPSTSGNVYHLGAQLPAYLERGFDGTEYAYFSHVARLEWAYQEVLVAADHGPLDLGRLQRVAPDEYPNLHFTLHPAVRLITSSYPVWTIWRANQLGADDQQTINLDSGAEHVLLLRTAEGVELRRIDSADFAFLSSLVAGTSLAAGASLADATASPLDVGACLRRYVGANVIVDFILPESADQPSAGDLAV